MAIVMCVRWLLGGFLKKSIKGIHNSFYTKKWLAVAIFANLVDKTVKKYYYAQGNR